ncbi:MAG: hypothetical protein JXR49_07000 [Acidobacteria bacterium]|nr:hypothetical protein [Acidobacteriota bacterium]
MKIKRDKLYAVLTGDIVGFSKLSVERRRLLHDTMRQGSLAAQKAFAGAIPLEADVFRGDSWQLLVADIAASLEVGLFLRAYLRAHSETEKLDTRMAIGIGTVDFVPDDRVSKGDGQAYRHSGLALEKMTRAGTMCFRFPNWELEESMDVMIHLIDVSAQNWSSRQALAVTGAIRGLKQEEIGNLWKPPISQQSVNRHLQRAGWFAVEKAIQFYKQQLMKAVK